MYSYTVKFKNPYIQQQSPVQYIKELRSIFSFSLKEARDLYDAMKEKPFDVRVFESPFAIAVSNFEYFTVQPLPAATITEESNDGHLCAAIRSAVDVALDIKNFSVAISLIRILDNLK